MHKIHFYKNKNGHEPVAEYKDEESRIKLKKSQGLSIHPAKIWNAGRRAICKTH